jgi:hypothetical protein
MTIRRWIVLAAALLLSTPAAAQSCPFAGQKPMLVVQLFFGQDIAGRRRVSTAQWNLYARRVLTAHFPDGLTVYDANGQWRDFQSKIVRERTKVVVIAVDASKDVRADVDAVTQIYKKQFHQQSVGVVSTPGCGVF